MQIEYPPPENTYLLNSGDAADLIRLEIQDKLATKGMGGVLSEHQNVLPPKTRRILDVGCGPGGWVIETAKKYPQVEVTGVDINPHMVVYSDARAKEARVRNAVFLEGNVLKPLDFPAEYFDLVNARLMVGFIKQESWIYVVKELYRLTRPGGIIRLTECDNIGVTTCRPAQIMSEWVYTMMHRLNYGFASDYSGFGITPMLGKFLEDSGCVKIQYKAHVINFSFGREFHLPQYQNYMLGFQLIHPLLHGLNIISSSDFFPVYERIKYEMLQEHFRGLWYLLTTWGEKPEYEPGNR